MRFDPAHSIVPKSKNPFAYPWSRSRTRITGRSEDKIIRVEDAWVTDIVIPYVSIRQFLTLYIIFRYFQDHGSYRRWEKHCRQPLTIFFLTKTSCVQFINTLLGTSTMAVGHGSSPCTVTLQHAFISDIPNHPSLIGRRIVLVDTPGFDNNSCYKRISSWLVSS
jgi:hypothetical protein